MIPGAHGYPFTGPAAGEGEANELRMLRELRAELAAILTTGGDVVETRTPDEADPGDPDSEVLHIEACVRSCDAPRLRQIVAGVLA